MNSAPDNRDLGRGEQVAKNLSSQGSGKNKLRLQGECLECGSINPMETKRCANCQAEIPAQKDEVINPLEHGVWGFEDHRVYHTLVCPPLSPVSLFEDKKYLIGRGEETDITLPGELVSRNHAEITFKDGAFHIEDLVSANGTFKNGEKVTSETALADGDTISIGGFQLKYQVRRGHEIKEKEVLQEIHAHATVVLEPGGESARGLVGRVQDIGVHKIICFVNANVLSGVLGIEAEGVEGGVNFAYGEVVDCWLASGRTRAEGEAAVRSLIALKEGRFSFREGPHSGDRRIEISTKELLQGL